MGSDWWYHYLEMLLNLVKTITIYRNPRTSLRAGIANWFVQDKSHTFPQKCEKRWITLYTGNAILVYVRINNTLLFFSMKIETFKVMLKSFQIRKNENYIVHVWSLIQIFHYLLKDIGFFTVENPLYCYGVPVLDYSSEVGNFESFYPWIRPNTVLFVISGEPIETLH